MCVREDLRERRDTRNKETETRDNKQETKRQRQETTHRDKRRDRNHLFQRSNSCLIPPPAMNSRSSTTPSLLLSILRTSCAACFFTLKTARNSLSSTTPSLLLSMLSTSGALKGWRKSSALCSSLEIPLLGAFAGSSCNSDGVADNLHSESVREAQ